MSTAAKIAANRANAKLSTGPRTPQGKARSSRNAVKFGLFSGAFTQPGEEPDYADLHADIRGAFDPQSPEEEAAVEKIFRAVWRLRRCNQVETTFVTPFDLTIRRARRQAHLILRKSVSELKQQKAIRKNEPNLPVAA